METDADALDFLLQSHEDLWFGTSILLTPPDSVQPEDCPSSPSDCTSLYSLHNKREIHTDTSKNHLDASSEEGDDDNYFDFESDAESELEFDPCIPESATSRTADDGYSEEQIRSFENIKKSLESVNAKCGEEQMTDIFIDITNAEYEILQQLDHLKKDLIRLNALEKQLTDAEEEKMRQNIVLLTEEGRDAEKLIHTGNYYPIMYETQCLFYEKFPHCVEAQNHGMSLEKRFTFQTAVLTSVVEKKMREIDAQFLLHLHSLGLTMEQIQFLKSKNYNTEAIAHIIRQSPNLMTTTVSPICQTWYSASGNVGAFARSVMNIYDLCSWKVKATEQAKQISLLDIFKDNETYKIDWMHVSKLMHDADPWYPLEPEACKLLWNNILNPANDAFDWTQSALLALRKIVASVGVNNWAEVAKRMGNGLSQFLCFAMHTNFVETPVSGASAPEPAYIWSEEEKQVVIDELTRGGSCTTGRTALNKYFPHTHFRTHDVRHCCRSMLKYAKPSKVHVSAMEDAVLLVTLEKLAPFLKDNRIPSSSDTSSILPFGKLLVWRTNTSWTHRLRCLFDEWAQQQWTVQEELKLIYLAEEYGNHPYRWSKISNFFDGIHSPYKNPTTLGNHYSKLKPVLANSTYIEYRKEYQDRRRNFTQYALLRNAFEVLQGIVELSSAKNKPKSFRGLPRNHPPNDVDLEDYLLHENMDWVHLAVRRIGKFLHSEVDDSKSQVIKYFDRRAFHREDPKSVASALHIRRLVAKPLEEINHLTKFEKLVALHLESFYKLSPTKITAARKYMPSAKELRSLPELSRILKRPICEIIAPSSSNSRGRRSQLAIASLPSTIPVEVEERIDVSDSIPVVNIEDKDNSHTQEEHLGLGSASTLKDFSSNNCDGPELKVHIGIPRLRDKKGRKASRLSNIRRMSAQRRWLNRDKKNSENEVPVPQPDSMELAFEIEV